MKGGLVLAGGLDNHYSNKLVARALPNPGDASANLLAIFVVLIVWGQPGGKRADQAGGQAEPRNIGFRGITIRKISDM